MSSVRVLFGLATGAVALAMVAFLVGGTPAVGRATAEEGGIVGAWSIAVQAGPDRPAVAFTSLYADGTVLTSNPASRPAPAGADDGVQIISAGHGAWKQTADRAYAFRFVYFQSDETGRLLGTTTIDATVELAADGQTFGGSFTATMVDPSGAVSGTGGGTVAGVRITVPESAATPIATPMS